MDIVRLIHQIWVITCYCMLLHVVACYYMLLHVTTWYYMLLHVTTCCEYYMLLHVATCYYLLSHVTTCYYRLLHVITCYYMNMLLTDIKCNLLLSTDQQMAKPFPLDTKREPETMMWYRNVLNLFTSQGLLGKWATPFQSISSQGLGHRFTQPNPPFLGLGQASITTYEPLHIPRGKVWHVALLDRWPSHAGMHPFGSDSHTAPPGLNLNNQASFVQDSCKHVWKKMKITKITYVDQSRLSTVIYSGHYFKMLATIASFQHATDFWLHTSLPANFQTATRPSRPNMATSTQQQSHSQHAASPALCPGPITLIIQFWKPIPIHAWCALQSVPLQGSTFEAESCGVHSNLAPAHAASRGLGCSRCSRCLLSASDRRRDVAIACPSEVTTASRRECIGCAASHEKSKE